METQDHVVSLIEKLLLKSIEKEEEGDLHTAVSCAQQALAEAVQADAFSVLTQSQVQLAHLFTRTGQYEQAEKVLHSVLDSSVELDPVTMANAWITLGICAAETDRPDLGEEYFHRAADISRQAGYTVGLGRSLHNLATCIYLNRGEFNLALSIMEEAQQARSSNGKLHWGLPFLQAYIYVTTGNRKRARQALDDFIHLVSPASRIMGGYFYLWARLALDEEELDKAEEYLRLLLHIASNTGAPDLNIWARMEYSRYYRLKGDPASAFSWAQDAVGYARRTNNGFLLGEAMIESAQASWELGNHSRAEDELESAMQKMRVYRSAFHLAKAAFLKALWCQIQQKPEADGLFLEASQALIQGGYTFILEREHDTAFPLVAANLRRRNLAVRKAAENLLADLSRVSPSPLRINGLGDLSVWQGRRLIPNSEWKRRKAGEMFRFLLLQPSYTAAREVIIEALWPEHSGLTAIDLLHQATSTLRHVLEPDLPDKFPSRYVFVEGECISLKLPEGSQIDFEEFETRLPTAIATGNTDHLQSILGLYRNDLFPKYRYADWSVSRREQLSDLYLRGMLALGQAFLQNQLHHQAISCVRIILQRDPWNEEAVLLGMEAYLSLQDAPHALQMYKKLERVLREELEMKPRSDLQALAVKIRKK